MSIDPNEIYDLLKLNLSDKKLNELLAYYQVFPFQEDKYNFGGKEVIPSRKSIMLGRDYIYSKQLKKSIPFDNVTTFLKHKIEDSLNLDRDYFNACLINYYPDNKASISLHKDNEPEMDSEAPIVALSIGATRDFFLTADSRINTCYRLKIKSGDILVMKPLCQKLYKHGIPKENKNTGPRISLTFRKFI